jgi:hypothetical protein
MIAALRSLFLVAVAALLMGAQPAPEVSPQRQPTVPEVIARADRDWLPIADLWAQSLMAIFAGMQVALTGIGIYFLKRTLDSTDNAVAEAEKATQAAQDAVNVNRLSAEQQLRAYVHPSEYAVAHLSAGSRATATIILKNLGSTPAHNFKSWTGIALAPADIDVDQFGIPGETVQCPAYVLPPQVKHTMNVVTQFPLTATDEARLLDGTCKIFVWGEATYVDVFGHEHYTRYCVESGAESFNSGALHASTKRNEAT